MALGSFTIFLLGIMVASSEIDFTLHCHTCKCMWSNGKKTADCKNLSLHEIPRTLSSQLRDIDFSNNPLYQLRANEFIKANLSNVHKLHLQNCLIETVHKNAFSGLNLLIELDLSRNNIVRLHREVFHETLKLRVLSLGYNKIRVLENGLFFNMSHLQKLDLSSNEIQDVNPQVFELLPILQHIDLSSNRLKTIEEDFTENLSRLNSLNMADNPWICNCHLQDFRNKVVKNNLITTPTTCEEPPRLRGSLWNEPSVIFACSPQIVEPLPETRIQVTSSSFTIRCKVLGEPQPDVDWVMNGRILDRDPRQNSHKFSLSKNKTGLFTWNNLTIANIGYRDRGEYKCVAKNPGGVDELNITLLINNDSDAGPASSMGFALPMIIGLVVGVIILILIILFLSCCLCKRYSRNFGTKRRDLSQSTEYVGLDGRPEMEKALITDVNPIVKPPRQCSVPPSVTSGVTEVSEANKTLLDADSIFAGDDESRSYEFDPRLQPKSQNHLDVDYRSDHPYPPDLLSFPHRIVQVSPAGSSASTVADTSRLPNNHGPQSPMSPLYDTVSVYRTLPYSRSQSPFVSPLGVPARIPRPGAYVTIPRRPRQSWSSEPPTSDIGEPLYDNLGLRTTATGSSVLSLNKLGELTSPKGTKQYPLTPTQCDPIAEHESPPSIATLPRSSSAQRSNAWNNAPLRTREQTNNNRRDSTQSLPTPNGKPAKIPPQPPPKPKKRTSTGPLFEDEGEDGTEV